MGRTMRLAALVAALAAAVGSIPARAAELIAVEHERCAICLRFDATVVPSYDRSPQGHIAPLRRFNAARGLPPDLASVRSVPTFILRDNGQEIGRIIGYRDKATFYRNVDMLLAAARQYAASGN